MELQIKINLNSGKEIELTENEYEELKQKFSTKEPVFVPYVPKEWPIYPTYPTYQRNPWDWNKVWCDSSDSTQIMDRVRFNNWYADNVTFEPA